MNVYFLIRYNIGGNELTFAGIVKGLDGSIFYAFELTYYALHLGQFYTESAHFHLSVLPSDKIDIPIRQHTYDISRTISPLIILTIVEVINDIHLGRLFRSVQITSGNTISGYIQFTGGTNRQTMTIGVSHIETVISDGLTYWDAFILPFNLVSCGEHRALRGSVSVIDIIRCRRFEWYKSLSSH